MKKLFIFITFCLLMNSAAIKAESVKVPDFKLPTATGEITPAQFKGKVLYVDFWASWCKPCKQSFPWLNQLQQQYKDQGLVVIAINLDKERALADKFLQIIPANFIVAFDPEGNSASSFKVKGMPSSYLIDRDGNVQGRHTGFREKDIARLEQSVAKLLQQ
ncbi:MAG: TlpA family protein disulfide reductase [Gammaproteobacteria bacterium]|nr:TlpA family protein disulfide reductase [Gammaproteobacteria bacterium]MDH5735664.1 TlpA family protein disulfide reductase [Gammaproteobacteria bacterium]